MRRALDERIVNESVYYIPHQNLVYFNNPKVACSTIKFNLWLASDQKLGVKTYSGSPHAREISPFARDVFSLDADSSSRLHSATTFSVVRNPFVRILSAYLDKVGEDQIVWYSIVKRFGLKESITKKELSFRDFIAIIMSEPDELLDTHFRSQYINLMWPIGAPDFLGYIENFAEVVEFLRRNNVGCVTFQAHATRAGGLVDEYYTDEIVEMVRNRFADDFRIFGYSTDIGRIERLGSVLPCVPGRDNLFAWIQTGEYPYDLVDEKTRVFKRFLEKPFRGREERLGIIMRYYLDEDNWRRLQTYLIYSVQLEEYALARAIFERINMLRSRHYNFVENRSIFLDGGVG